MGQRGITVAWESYMQYNDTRMLAEHYGAMKSYIQYLVEYIDTETACLPRGTWATGWDPNRGKTTTRCFGKLTLYTIWSECAG